MKIWIAGTKKIYHFLMKVISVEEDTQTQVFILGDITEENFIFTKLCAKKKYLHYFAGVLNKNEDN